MDRTSNPLIALMRLTLTDPAGGARQVLALDLPRDVLWQGFALVTVLSVLATELTAMVAPGAGGLFVVLRQSPIMSGLLQAGFLFAMVHATHRIGAAFGGRGSFDDSLALVVWLQVMLLVLQLLQIVAIVVLPPVAPLVGLAALAWFFWVLTAFVRVLHGFSSGIKVFLGILLAFVAVAVALSLALTMLGVVVVPETMR
jgi:hypothetical protein